MEDIDESNYLSNELAVLSNSLKIGREDEWIRSIQSESIDETRTLKFEFHCPLNVDDRDLDSQYRHILIPSAIISVYFPKSPNDKPFCFYEESIEDIIDQQFILRAVEHANEVSHT